jgi:sugar lactone lactonase YvrE
MLTGGMMMHASRLIALCAVAATSLVPAAAVMAEGVASAAPVAATASHARPSAVPGGTRLWVQRFTGRTGRTAFGSGVAASPDGSVVYVTGTTGQQLTGKARAYTTVAYSAATGAMLWQVHFQGANSHFPFGGFDSRLPFIKVSPDGSTVFVVGAIKDNVNFYLILAYNAHTGAQLWTAEPVQAASAFLAQGQPVAVSPDSGTVYVTGTPRGEGPDAYRTVALSAATGAPAWVANTSFPPLFRHQATAIAASPDGSAVFVTGQNGTVALNASTGATLWQDNYKLRWNRSPNAVAVSDSGMVYVSGGAQIGGHGAALTIAYNAATGARVWRAIYEGPGDRTGGSRSLVLSPDGSKLFVIASLFRADGTQEFNTLGYDAATGTRLWSAVYAGPPKLNAIPDAVAVSPTGSAVFVTGFVDTSSGVLYATVGYDAATGAPLWQARMPGLSGASTIPLSLTVSPDGSRVFVTGASSQNPVWGPSEYLTVAYGA